MKLSKICRKKFCSNLSSYFAKDFSFTFDNISINENNGTAPK